MPAPEAHGERFPSSSRASWVATTVDRAGQTYQDVIAKWRSVHAADIANYQSWRQDYR